MAILSYPILSYPILCMRSRNFSELLGTRSLGTLGTFSELSRNCLRTHLLDTEPTATDFSRPEGDAD